MSSKLLVILFGVLILMSTVTARRGRTRGRTKSRVSGIFSEHKLLLQKNQL